MFFYFGELAWLASIKCRFVRPFEGVNSSLPFATSPAPPRVRDLTRPMAKLAIWPPILASRSTDCPIINRKSKVVLFFLRRPGCFRLHSAAPEGTSRNLAWPGSMGATQSQRGFGRLHYRFQRASAIEVCGTSLDSTTEPKDRRASRRWVVWAKEEPQTPKSGGDATRRSRKECPKPRIDKVTAAAAGR